MDANRLVDEIQDATHPHGRVLVHVTDRDTEYWLEVTDIIRSQTGETPWVDGVVIETKPIPDGPHASRAIFNPRPYFTPTHAIQKPTQIVELPEEFHDVAAGVNTQLSDIGPREEFVRETDDLARKQKFVDEFYQGHPDLPDKVPGLGNASRITKAFLGDMGIVPETTSDGMIPLRSQKTGEITGYASPSAARELLEAYPPVPITSDETELKRDPKPTIYGISDEHGHIRLRRDYSGKIGIPLPVPPEYLDQSEPHYTEARELNGQQVVEALDVDPALVRDDEQARRNLAHQLNERSFLPRSTDKDTKDKEEDQ